MIRVLIADDQPLMRAAFDMTIRAEPDMAVVGEAADGSEAVEMARDVRPDVVLMDVRMPVLDGVEATRQLSAQADPPKVLLLTTFEIDSYAIEALRAGASGFLLKDAPPQELARAVRAAHAGEALLDPAVAARLVSAFAGDAEPLDSLTPRERDVLVLIGRGFPNKQIARELDISEKTVKTHVGHVLAKLGVADRTQAAVVAVRAGLVNPRS